ncbi:MAG: hypothetical protein J6K41_00295 [Paraprevotella sp.]|nr:hypothetical protein [Paraprevotella sp.]
MKKVIYFITASTMLLIQSCGNKKSVVTQAPQNAAPFGEVYSMPCGNVKDTPEKFAAVGIYRGSSYQKGECHLNAIANAQAIIREKYHHAYKGMISNYSSTIGNNRGNDIATKLERAGDVILDAMLNDAYEVCTKFSNVFDDGMIECYVGIEIPKGELAEKVAKKVADVLTDEEKEKINFNEYNYRKQMEERMKNYKDGQK